MNEYIFYTLEGYTISPTNIEVENCQLLGFAKGENSQDALANLIIENQWIIEYGFNVDKIISRQVVSQTDIRNFP